MATHEVEVMGSKLEGAKRGFMREAVGKGKVEYTPIAILSPSKEEQPPSYYQLGTKLKLDAEAIRQRRPGLKSKRVFTNKNIITQEYEYSTSAEESSMPSSVSSKSSVPSILANVEVAACVREMVTYLVEEVGLTQKDGSYFMTSAPSVLGASLGEVKEEVHKMEAVGFTKKEVAKIITLFPSSVAMDWANVREIYLFLHKDLNMTRGLVYSLMKCHPIMFILPHLKVRLFTTCLSALTLSPSPSLKVCECLSKLQSLELSPSEIGT